ncbi:hypothetical protein PsYK624_034740 [Phanerochaete sordida]|uniref:Uncharacterized protein n=1 Tax=Phanerochaete sordida TaxID=48140 RepID=A0A9P3G370_9APHY|nr:hypothetical protein PsYK624_034740 [Phanerochaete sordida]
MDDEAVHIWLTSFQPFKILYLFTRYYFVLALIILNTRALTCKGPVIIEGTSAVLLVIVVEIILILRIYAMYTANRRLLYVLVPTFVAQMTIMAASLGVSLPQMRDSAHCADVVFPPKSSRTGAIASVAFEGVLVALTLCRYFIARAEGWGRAGLMTILVRDGVWAFVLLFVANLANTLFFTIAPATLAALGFPWLLALLGALGPRLILNIRREHKRALPDSLDDVDVDLSGMTEYAAVGTDEHDEASAWSSRLSLASWKSSLSWRRSSIPWDPKAV